MMLHLLGLFNHSYLMGVERQTAKINWITSLTMVVMAGTFYRLRNVMKKLTQMQVKDLREMTGHIYQSKS